MTRILKIYIIESKHQALAAYVWLFSGVCILKMQLVLLIKKKETIYDLHLNIIYVLMFIY